MSTGRIPWPRCRAFGTHGGGSGIMVDDELARAVRTEAAKAIGWWWGVNVAAVAWWRRALGVTRTNNDGSRRLIHQAAVIGDAASRERGVTPAERELRRTNALRLNLRRHLGLGGGRPLWQPWQVKLLGTLPDAVLAKRFRRTVEAVRVRR
jgi:hypothetical protein